MRIAFTGSTSTGKTTLVEALLQDPTFSEYVSVHHTVDARHILQNLGFHSMDPMTPEETRYFQLTYFIRKLYGERGRSSFVTERSFVDIAAYWMERDTLGCSQFEQRILMDPCEMEAKSYEIHFYLPFDVVPFQSDGWRSEDLDFHRRVDRRIHSLLEAWKINYVTLSTPSHTERIETVLRHLRRISASQ